MSWVRIEDTWLSADHIESLGAETILLHLTALSHCAAQESDGWLSQRALRRLWPVNDLAAAVAALEAAGEWAPADDGWQLANWHQHLLSAAEMTHRREQSRVTSERHRRHKAGDHTMCDRCSFVRGDKSVTTSLTQSVTPLRLDSPRLVSKRSERDETENAGTASATATTAPGKRELPPHPARGTDPFNCLCGLPNMHPIHKEAVLA